MIGADVWVGYDPVDELAAVVCASSIRRRSPGRVVRYLRSDDPQIRAVYDRPSLLKNGQRFDCKDQKPFSTDFSFRRFLVPYLNGYEGWAVFSDPDMLWCASMDELMELADPKYAVMVVKHNHHGAPGQKMHGVMQTDYHRKNWSSLILWNCGHPANRHLTPHEVNDWSGSELHAFKWLADNEIGALDESWNWLVGYSPTTRAPGEFVGTVVNRPKIIHWTDGGPWLSKYSEAQFADLWRMECKDFWWHGR